jgi:hypothetical protein
VLSVLWVGLRPAAAVVLFMLEAWVYMSLRAAVEIACEHISSDPDRVRKLLRKLPA